MSNSVASVQANRGSWLAVLAIAFLVRGGVLLTDRSALSSDPDAYRQLGTNLAFSGTLGFTRRVPSATGTAPIQPTAYRPPLYCALIALCAAAGFDTMLLLSMLHCVLGVATCLLVFQTAKRFVAERMALLAAVLIALDPLLLWHSTLVMTETLAAFLAALLLFAVGPANQLPNARRTFWQGILLGLLALCRPVFLLFGAVWCLWMLIRSGNVRQRVYCSLICTFAASFVVAPWVGRNWVHWGKLIPGTTHGGYTLYLANNPSFYGYLRDADWGEVWRPDQTQYKQVTQASKRAIDRDYLKQTQALLALAERDEPAADRLAYRLAWQNISGDSISFSYACFVRLGRFWQLAPHQTDVNESSARAWLRYAIGVGYGLEFVLVAIGLVCLGRRWQSEPWIAIVLLAGSLTLVHALFWTNMRMRAPLQPGLALLAAYGWAQISSRFCRRNGPTLG